MRRTRRSVSMGAGRTMLCLTLAATSAALGLAPASAGAAATLPPELQTLEQKAQALHIASERFSLNFTIKEPSGTETMITGIGTERISPPATQLVESVGSKRLVVRVVGGELYEDYPGLARVDGGRPWVRTRESQLSAQTGVNFAKEPKDLTESFSLVNTATEGIQEVGPVTVDGQATTEFTANVNLEQLFSRFGKTVVQKLEPAGIRQASLALYIAPTGLPVRTSVSIGVEGGTIMTTADILATEVPVSVQAPPAHETISQGEFRKLLSQHPKLEATTK